MNAQTIYNILRAGGLSRAGALGMLGNLMAESSLIPNIVQRGMQSLSDEEYTRLVDAGVKNFEDSCGFGLAQFTFYSRKRALLQFARSQGVSVGDGEMQCHFIIKELKEDFPGLYRMLCESEDIGLCSDRVCDTYERPAVNNFQTRRSFAYQFEQQVFDEMPEPPSDDRLERVLALLDELREILKEVL